MSDVLVNSRTPVEGLDITGETDNVQASEYMDIEFVPRKKSLPPVLNGLELVKLN